MRKASYVTVAVVGVALVMVGMTCAPVDHATTPAKWVQTYPDGSRWEVQRGDNLAEEEWFYDPQNRLVRHVFFDWTGSVHDVTIDPVTGDEKPTRQP